MARRPAQDPRTELSAQKSALVVCGPTAGGKSDLSDALAEKLTGTEGRNVPTLAVDSMQVYRELPGPQAAREAGRHRAGDRGMDHRQT